MFIIDCPNWSFYSCPFSISHEDYNKINKEEVMHFYDILNLVNVAKYSQKYECMWTTHSHP